jgi:hypothetical protein
MTGMYFPALEWWQWLVMPFVISAYLAWGAKIGMVVCGGLSIVAYIIREIWMWIKEELL